MLHFTYTGQTVFAMMSFKTKKKRVVKRNRKKHKMVFCCTCSCYASVNSSCRTCHEFLCKDGFCFKTEPCHCCCLDLTEKVCIQCFADQYDPCPISTCHEDTCYDCFRRCEFGDMVCCLKCINNSSQMLGECEQCTKVLCNNCEFIARNGELFCTECA